MSTWWNRKTGSSPQYVPVGSICSRRRRRSSVSSTSPRASPGASANSAPSGNSGPTTDASSMIRRSRSGSRSTRVASNDWIVGGTSTASGIDGQFPPGGGRGDDAVVDEHPHQLAYEQRIAVGRRRQAIDQLSRQFAGSQQLGSELERSPPHRARRARSPRSPDG